ncbi:AAA family ATPase [Streptomyces sp. NPDC051776]|uniref:helix-turn-helix transcriptional regulator n=1 Tax=Streptomyces sp. NPDC051776 TaxID=3155414 RepID=UPI00342FFDF3
MSGPNGELPGRAAERHALDAVIARVGTRSRTVLGTRSGRAVLVEGEPGIGKTALLRASAADARSHGVRVLEGAAEQLERRVPFAAIGRCLGIGAPDGDPRVRRVAAMIRGEGQPDAMQARDADFAIVEAILALLDEWCASGPLALLIDDVHWADEASLLLLHRLGKSLATLPMAVVCAYRPVPDEGLERLRRSLTARDARVLTLGPLGDDAVSKVAEDLLGTAIGPRLRRLLRGASGNPLFVTEVVESLERDRLIRVAEGTAEAVTSSVPQSLASAVLSRLEWISDEGLALLRAASLLGSSFTVSDLSTVTGHSAAKLVEPVLEVVRCGALTECGDRLAFRHDLIRQALYESTPSRAASHTAVARALARSGAPVERVAEHLLLGAGYGWDGTVDWLLNNAGTLILRAPALGVELLGQVLKETASDDTRGDTLQLMLAYALLWDGRASDARERAEAALRGLHDNALRAELLWVLVQADTVSGQLEGAAQRTREALAPGTLSPEETLRFQGFLSTAMYFLGNLDEAEAAARKVQERARGTEQTDATIDALQTLVGIRQVRGEIAAAVEGADHALQSARAQPMNTHRQVALQLIRAACLFELDRGPEAQTGLEAGFELAERSGGILLATCHMCRATFMFHSGQWDDALAEIDVALELPAYLGIPRAFQGLAALIAAYRGEFATAKARLAAADQVTTPSPTTTYYEYLVHWAQQILLQAQGHRQEALTDLRQGWRHGFGPVTGRAIPCRAADLVRLALEAGDRATAEDVTVSLELRNASEQHATLRMRGIAAHCRGLLDADPAVMAAAADAYARSNWAVSRAQYHEDAAAVLAEAGRMDEARTELDTALGMYADLHADWCAEQAEARLGAHGVVRRRQRRRERRPTSGWAALTETEHRVAALVAEGLSNPTIAAQMFVSRRTVQSHVSSILAKLALSSRVELATYIAGRR